VLSYSRAQPSELSGRLFELRHEPGNEQLADVAWAVNFEEHRTGSELGVLRDVGDAVDRRSGHLSPIEDLPHILHAALTRPCLDDGVQLGGIRSPGLVVGVAGVLDKFRLPDGGAEPRENGISVGSDRDVPPIPRRVAVRWR